LTKVNKCLERSRKWKRWGWVCFSGNGEWGGEGV